MVWRDAFDVTFEFVLVVQVTGYSSLCNILKLYINFSLQAEWLN